MTIILAILVFVLVITSIALKLKLIQSQDAGKYFKTEFDTTQEQLEKYMALSTHLAGDKLKLQTDIDNLIASNKRLKDYDLQLLKTSNAELESSRKAAVDQIDKLENQIIDINTDRSNIDTEKRKLATQVGQLTADNQILRDRNKNLVTVNEDLLKISGEDKITINNLEQVNDNQATWIRNATQFQEDLENDIKNRQKDLEELQRINLSRAQTILDRESRVKELEGLLNKATLNKPAKQVDKILHGKKNGKV